MRIYNTFDKEALNLVSCMFLVYFINFIFDFIFGYPIIID